VQVVKFSKEYEMSAVNGDVVALYVRFALDGWHAHGMEFVLLPL